MLRVSVPTNNVVVVALLYVDILRSRRRDSAAPKGGIRGISDYARSQQTKISGAGQLANSTGPSAGGGDISRYLQHGRMRRCGCTGISTVSTHVLAGQAFRKGLAR
jgi:hypothetical protein